MRSAFMKLIVLLSLFIIILPVSADLGKENPSFYSFADIVQKLPEIWTSNPESIMEMMKDYPDFTCYRNHDIIGCVSVNNKYSSEVHVNYQFSSDDDQAELVRTTFAMNIDSSEEVQAVMEEFWLEDLTPLRVYDAFFPNDQIILYFHNENTLMTVTVPMSADGNFYLIMVDFGLIRG